MKVLSLLVLLSLTSAAARDPLGRSLLRGGASNRTASAWPSTTTSQEIRILSSENAAFVPLSCNFPRCNRGTSNWNRENYNPNSRTVVIPCGECIHMNYNGDKLLLPHGLDIQGELIFADGYKVEIETPFVRVQGKLVMRDTSPITGNPNVKITLTGGDASVTSFVPAGENEFTCSTSLSARTSCSVGAKAVVVAGGQLDIQATPQGCKTWVHLEQVATNRGAINPTQFERFPDVSNHPIAFCRSKTNFIDTDFSEENDIVGWSGNGAPFERTAGGTLRVFDRSEAFKHGPIFSILNVRDCVQANQDYLFHVRVRLLDRTAPLGSASSCTKSNENCLAVQRRSAFPTGGLGASIGNESPEDGLLNGEWKDLTFTMQFDENELAEGATLHAVRMVGPLEHVEIEVDSMRLSLPSPRALPDPTHVCGGNLLRNGDASLDSVHAYPFETNRAVVEVWTSNGGNRYFRVDHRESDNNGLVYFFGAPGCLVSTATYRFSMRIRMQSPEPVAAKVVLRAFLESGAADFEVASCPPSNRVWIECGSDFVLPPDFPVAEAQRLRLSIHTIDGPTVPYFADDFSLELLEGIADGLIVQSNGIVDCWDQGAELLITSHTVDMDDSQVRRLRSAPVSIGNGMVRLTLDSAILPPISRDDGEFPVEIALLSRNVVLEGASDERDTLLGGHLIVLHTPNVVQTLSGVEFVNFGRQGELGRYPIHFHMSENVQGSIVEKNSIHHSNQRGVVIHGSHNVTVKENIAYDVLGHTFMTEDGGEMDNLFEWNLGACTKPVTRLVRDFETDRSSVSTFWISNPVNSFVGNVAAGSQANGFWFELQTSVRSPTSLLSTSQGLSPRHLPVTLFVDNIAHSNGIHGVRTYPFGLAPPAQAVFHNTSSYKNRRDGIFIHNSRDLAIVGGILADNEIQVDFDRADNLEIRGTTLMGLSPSYRNAIETQHRVFVHDDDLIGIEIHSFAHDSRLHGSTITNVNFEHFTDTFNERVSLIKIEPDERESGRFDYWTDVSGVHFESSVDNVFDFRGALENGVSDSFIVDLDGSMNPSGLSTGRVGTALVNSEEMKAFLDLSKCQTNSEGMSLYCSGICLRSILFSTDPGAQTDNLSLRITSGSSRTSFDFPGKFFYEMLDNGDLDNVANLNLNRRRLFAAALPMGEYTAEFIDSRTGASLWPGFVETTLEPSSCEASISLKDVDLKVPPPIPSRCIQHMILNGNMENGLSPWLHTSGNIGLVSRGGFAGSTALSDSGSDPRSFLGQFLDSRCLTQGSVFRIQVRVKLTNGGRATACSSCPRLFLRLWIPRDDDGSEYKIQNVLITDTFVSQSSTDGWEFFDENVEISNQVASATSVAIIVEKRESGVTMMLDDFSMNALEPACGTIVRNGDFSDGTSSFWKETGGALGVETVDGNFALALNVRDSRSDTITQNLQTGCLREGERYAISARLRFRKPDLTLFQCDPTERNTETSCPRLRLLSLISDGSRQGNTIALTDHGETGDGWYTMSGLYHATDFDDTATSSVLSMVEAPDQKSLVIDDVMIQPVFQDCRSNLLVNGDADRGETAMFWTTYLNDDGAVISLVPNGANNYAFKVSNRLDAGDGISQRIDHRCLETGTTWKFTASIGIWNGNSLVECDPDLPRLDRGCPPVRLIGHRDGVRLFEDRFAMSRVSTSGNMSSYEASIPVSSALASCDTVLLSVRTFNLDWDLVVDDMSLVLE